MAERARQKEAVAKFLQRATLPSLWTVPIGKAQERERKDPGVPGNLCVSKVSWPVDTGPELKQVVQDAWAHLCWDAATYFDFDSPSVMTGEWVGRRHGFAYKDSSPAASPEQAYQTISAETGSSVTILYFFGGGFIRGSAARSRRTTGALATLCNAKVFTLDYRLAPQHPLPAPILDALIAYFYLLYPPPGSFHQPVPADSIIIAGESSGGALAAALIQCLLHLHRQNPTNPTTTFNGRTVPVPLPAGMAVLSPGFDFGLSLPSFDRCQETDWILGADPRIRPNFPADHLWPSSPPRLMPYCHDSALVHPFLNAASTALENFRGFPPVWIACGDETLIDGALVFAKHVAMTGASVQLVRYEGMPHIFPLLIKGVPQSQHCIAAWARACSTMVKQRQSGSQETSFESKGTVVEMGELNERHVKVTEMTDLDLKEVRKRMWSMRIRCEGLVWTGPKKDVPHLGKL